MIDMDVAVTGARIEASIVSNLDYRGTVAGLIKKLHRYENYDHFHAEEEYAIGPCTLVATVKNPDAGQLDLFTGEPAPDTIELELGDPWQ